MLLLQLHKLEFLELGYSIIRASDFFGYLLRHAISTGFADCCSKFSKLKDIHYLVGPDYRALCKSSGRSKPKIDIDQVTLLFYLSFLEIIDIIAPPAEDPFFASCMVISHINQNRSHGILANQGC